MPAQVRHVERMEARKEDRGRRSNEEHQRYLNLQKKRLEAVAVTDDLPASRKEEGPSLPLPVD